MNCAIYARRSTEEHQAASLEIQIETAREFIRKRGWDVATAKIFSDDAVSRAEFLKRPGLHAMLAAARAKHINLLVVRDESRLGGDMVRTMMVLSELVDLGVRVFYAESDSEVTLNGPTEKLIQVVRGYSAEMEREKLSGRTREHLQSKARRGFVAGGKCFGYANHGVFEGDRRVHVEHVVDPEQAKVVLEIFRRYAEGWGVKRIAKELNARGVPPPRAGKRGTGSWAPSVIWEMVRNDRYHGKLIWGRTQKGYAGGTKVRRKCDPESWEVTERPELKIIPDELWAKVQTRILRTKKGTSPKGGRPTRYLLSGLTRCGNCGGPLTVANHRIGTETVKVYTCAYHRERGNSVCDSTVRRPVSGVNSAVVEWIKDNVFHEELIVETLKVIHRRLRERSAATTTDVPTIEEEARELRVEIDRLVSAIATTAQPPEPLVTAIGQRQTRLGALEAHIRASNAAPEAISLELRRMESEAKKRLLDLRGALERNPAEARAVLEGIFDGKLVAHPIDTPDGRRFQVEGTASVGKMLISEFSNSASPTGFECGASVC